MEFDALIASLSASSLFALPAALKAVRGSLDGLRVVIGDVRAEGLALWQSLKDLWHVARTGEDTPAPEPRPPAQPRK